MAKLPKRYKDAQQGIETFNIGDMIRVDHVGPKDFFLHYPNGFTGPCTTGDLAPGQYYLDYVFDEDNNPTILDTGLPDIMFKTPLHYVQDTPLRKKYQQQEVSCTIYTVTIIRSCTMITQ